MQSRRSKRSGVVKPLAGWPCRKLVISPPGVEVVPVGSCCFAGGHGGIKNVALRKLSSKSPVAEPAMVGIGSESLGLMANPHALAR